MLAAAHGLIEEVTHTVAASKRTATEQRITVKSHEIENMRK